MGKFSSNVINQNKREAVNAWYNELCEYLDSRNLLKFDYHMHRNSSYRTGSYTYTVQEVEPSYAFGDSYVDVEHTGYDNETLYASSILKYMSKNKENYPKIDEIKEKFSHITFKQSEFLNQLREKVNDTGFDNKGASKSIFKAKVPDGIKELRLILGKKETKYSNAELYKKYNQVRSLLVGKKSTLDRAKNNPSLADRLTIRSGYVSGFYKNQFKKMEASEIDWSKPAVPTKGSPGKGF